MVIETETYIIMSTFIQHKINSP